MSRGIAAGGDLYYTLYYTKVKYYILRVIETMQMCNCSFEMIGYEPLIMRLGVDK